MGRCRDECMMVNGCGSLPMLVVSCPLLLCKGVAKGVLYVGAVVQSRGSELHLLMQLTTNLSDV